MPKPKPQTQPDARVPVLPFSQIAARPHREQLENHLRVLESLFAQAITAKKFVDALRIAESAQETLGRLSRLPQLETP